MEPSGNELTMFIKVEKTTRREKEGVGGEGIKREKDL